MLFNFVSRTFSKNKLYRGYVKKSSHSWWKYFYKIIWHQTRKMKKHKKYLLRPIMLVTIKYINANFVQNLTS